MMGIYIRNRVQMLRDAVTGQRGRVRLSILEAGTQRLGKRNYVLSKFISGVS